jgi:TPR repeat protein
MSFFAHTSHAESYQAGLTSYLAKDYPLAVKQFQIAAEQGLAEAQFHLGNMHYMGLGTPKDFGQALRWYHLAAAQGNANALFKLGFMYDSGLGTPQDYLRSHMWLNLAGSRGSKTAIEYRDDIAKK